MARKANRSFLKEILEQLMTDISECRLLCMMHSTKAKFHFDTARRYSIYLIHSALHGGSGTPASVSTLVNAAVTVIPG